MNRPSLVSDGSFLVVEKLSSTQREEFMMGGGGGGKDWSSSSLERMLGSLPMSDVVAVLLYEPQGDFSVKRRNKMGRKEGRGEEKEREGGGERERKVRIKACTEILSRERNGQRVTAHELTNWTAD